MLRPKFMNVLKVGATDENTGPQRERVSGCFFLVGALTFIF